MQCKMVVTCMGSDFYFFLRDVIMDAWKHERFKVKQCKVPSRKNKLGFTGKKDTILQHTEEHQGQSDIFFHDTNVFFCLNPYMVQGYFYNSS